MRYKTRLLIHSELFAENVKRIRDAYPRHKILFMVKANGYGHGLVEMARLAIQHGIQDFGVATASEARALRDELFDHFFNIYVFSDLDLDFSFHKELYLNNRILPVISHLDDLRLLLQDSDFKYFPLCIKFNTGMNRLGFQQNSIWKLIELLNSYDRKIIHHLFAHLSTSSDPDDPFTKVQLDNFTQVKKILRNEDFSILNSSISNSGAIEQGLVSDDDNFIRPGILLYGPSALVDKFRNTSKVKNKLISSLQSYIIDKLEISAGNRVGYNGISAPSDGHLLLLAIGYGDGLTFYNRDIHIKINGEDALVLGRPNMDMMQIFISGDTLLSRGDNVGLWSTNEDVFNITDQIDSISYELFCLIGERISRVYL
jgi:alanine racemase